MIMTKSYKNLAFTLAACLLLGGLLQGCGTKPAASASQGAASDASKAAASSDSSAAGGNSSGSENGKDAKQGGRFGGDRANRAAGREDALKKMLEQNGVTGTDATDLAQQIQTNHVQMKWVTDQLKSGKKAADVIADIKAGKAPKQERPGGKKDNANDAGKKDDSSGSGSAGAGSQDASKSS
jgi:hypothetical protein